MGKTVTIGGDRLGSGNKMQTRMRNYNRSTHNLTYKFASSLAAGVLYPFMCIPVMRGDSFAIDLDAAARTIPTQGPLFGSFKMQIDVFQCPFRLYQAILHNNPTAIGLRMAQIKLPKLNVHNKYERVNGKKLNGAFAPSCLQKYLGMSGIGRGKRTGDTTQNITRKYLAIPTLAYYDIFKNYYANKQEEFAYAISGHTEQFDSTGTIIRLWDDEEQTSANVYEFDYSELAFEMENINPQHLKLAVGFGETGTTDLVYKYVEGTLYDLWKKETAGIVQNLREENGKWYFNLVQRGAGLFTKYVFYFDEGQDYTNKTLELVKFPLSNIDDMRMKVLSHHTLGAPFVIDTTDDIPYSLNVDVDETTGYSLNCFPHNGLVLKTYQSDMFNNWVDTEWIDGENGIAEITKIAVSDGSFKIDALNLAEKLYNMLNRVAVSGATYEDWQDAVYTQSPRRHIESPVYLGGSSNEVVFEEIIQTAPADGDALGTLGGRGILKKRKGGYVNVKVDEASFIIGIVSLTPRIYQTQGNEWYNTELDSMDDLHKPALDGIGFQNLIGERMAWFDTEQRNDGTLRRSVIGKLPAWIEYMTNVDKAYGDFADVNGKGFMILNRNYEFDGNNDANSGIKDATTYIDPRKYNYAFAYTDLDAQNFWVQIESKIKARRLMSAHQIPNV